jgi:hypothetical protein
MGVNIDVNNSSSQESLLKSFTAKAEAFMKKTELHALQGVKPGGYYQAIWCRDASFILRSWLHSGNIHGVLQKISIIWSHQIVAGKEKIIYGRGSPVLKYKPTVAKEDKQKMFEGALPTTIYQLGYSEVYGLNPDIDSTALMINTTAWALTKLLTTNLSAKSSLASSSYSFLYSNLNRNTDHNSAVDTHLSKSKTNMPPEGKLMTNRDSVIEFVVPCMLKAIDYLLTRDVDKDSLLEQDHNEDWMDTALRAGKIVYSQACLILALNNLSYLLSEIGEIHESERMAKVAAKTIYAVEDKLWSEANGSYIDIQESHHIGGPYRTLTQDASLYLIAISENTNSDSLGNRHQNREHQHNKPDVGNLDNEMQHVLSPIKKEYHTPKQDQKTLDLILKRANSTLDAIRNRVRINSWSVNIETLLKRSGPWHLKPYFYHNRTFWPWITGIEMLARSRFGRFDECDILLSKLASEDKLHILTFYEWVDPKTGKGGGAYPFRTGVCTVRIAIDHILSAVEKSKNVHEMLK